MSGVPHDNALGHRASTKRSLTEFLAKTHPRFHLVQDGLYLHWSGTKLTSNRRHAYVGSASQVEAIQRSISLAAGCRAREV